MYSLDYERSRQSFRSLIEAEPDNPLGYLFESGGIWWQAAAEYGLFKGTPTLQGLFEQDIEFAIRKAEPWTKSKDEAVRIDGHFVTGMALGTKGMWSSLRGHWMDACLEGKKAVKHLKKCLKLDPEYHDANLGLGVFDYQVGRLPVILRSMALLCGVSGSEKRGLARIRSAMEKGRHASRQAAQFLSTIYFTDQHDYARALAIIEELRAQYPESVYFQFLSGVIRYRLGDWGGSLKEIRNILAAYQSDPAGFQRKLLSLVCGLTGEKCLARGDIERALPWFRYALEKGADADLDPPESRTLLLLYRGISHDMLSQRVKAKADYEAALAGPDFAGSHALSRECLGAPCDIDTVRSYLRALSRAEPWTRPRLPAKAGTAN